MHPSLRLIDANANRAREALRIMEDAARFLLDHASLTTQLKLARHDLAAALAHLPGGNLGLFASRDTPGDVGTAISTPSEFTRTSSRDVVTASAKRLTEALRAIEEYSKTLASDHPASAECARAIEQLRYRAYDLERNLLLAMGTRCAPQWSLCVLITESLCDHHSWQTVARQAIDNGAECIQLREKSLSDAELLSRARFLVDLAHPRSVSVIINDRADVALASGADGVHLGQGDLPISEVRVIAGDRLLIGISTANIIQARAALQSGADYCGVGPMFPTTTKHKDTIAGPAYLREYLAHEPPLPPHLAIGGIAPRNLQELISAGVRGVAVSSAVCSATDPGAVCRELRSLLNSSHEVSQR